MKLQKWYDLLAISFILHYWQRRKTREEERVTQRALMSKGHEPRLWFNTFLSSLFPPDGLNPNIWNPHWPFSRNKRLELPLILLGVKGQPVHDLILLLWRDEVLYDQIPAGTQHTPMQRVSLRSYQEQILRGLSLQIIMVSESSALFLFSYIFKHLDNILRAFFSSLPVYVARLQYIEERFIEESFWTEIIKRVIQYWLYF